ncbi:hypothetical protein H5410_008352 [Solanum commersonii]|uniref:Uncharacterized protein n=1 Tax=Solanum commersonii TaxID=4109 RepID=A0A9J6AEP1_SOLCO|nr:hypothetical protein H5410_008352 [Solanum commersonii]
MLTKFKTGVGSTTYILKLQDHLPGKLRSLFRFSSHKESMELDKIAIYPKFHCTNSQHSLKSNLILISQAANICHTSCSKPFANQPKKGKVPCILGVNLTDVDLLEFIQQLADTDGSSIVPPSVNRILNNKACRTKLHCVFNGRATTVPLFNLGALHEQIAKLGSWSRSSSEAWHGLHWLEINLERAAKRLRSAVS